MYNNRERPETLQSETIDIDAQRLYLLIFARDMTAFNLCAMVSVTSTVVTSLNF
jgi:hypothetical protein